VKPSPLFLRPLPVVIASRAEFRGGSGAGVSDHLVQAGGEVSHRRTSEELVFEATTHQVVEGGRDAPVKSDGLGPALQLLVAVLLVVGVERGLAGGSLEEHRTYSPHVGSRVKIAATGLLGGHVFERAHTLLAPPRGRAMPRSSTFASSRSETILDGLKSRCIALPLCHGSFRALCRRAGQAAQEDN
jgi:hypothetical protein